MFITVSVGCDNFTKNYLAQTKCNISTVSEFSVHYKKIKFVVAFIFFHVRPHLKLLFLKNPWLYLHSVTQKVDDTKVFDIY